MSQQYILLDLNASFAFLLTLLINIPHFLNFCEQKPVITRKLFYSKHLSLRRELFNVNRFSYIAFFNFLFGAEATFSIASFYFL